MKPLEIDMCAGSQLKDTQGETLSIEGADIAEMLAGRGRLNDNHGKGFFNCIGKVTKAKKIFKKSDCEDERQNYYWDKVKSPYIYVRGVLFNDEDHPNAKAAAAILRNIHKSDCPLKVKASVEGGTVARGISDPSFLARTKIHSVALTFVPANQNTLVEPLDLDKSADHEADMELIKSVMHLAQTDVPTFRQITRDASASKIEANINAILDMMGEDGLELKKALVQESLESKIAENIQRINELVKGSMNRLAPFDPNDVPIEYRRQVNSWLSGGVEDVPEEYQYKWPPPMDGALKARSLHSLHNKTQTRRNPKTGEREFLLHRGFPKFHADGSLKDEVYQTPEDHPLTSWSWNQKVADMWGGILPEGPPSKGFSISAWVPESQIHLVPHMIGDVPHQDKIFAPDAAESMGRVDRSGGIGEAEVAVASSKAPITIAAIRRHPEHASAPEWKPKLAKALTAGYGGAGSPGNLTGGGVLQSESMPKSFRYITCDECGKEQVYGKFQVKCRECNKPFSLVKLEKFFRGGK